MENTNIVEGDLVIEDNLVKRDEDCTDRTVKFSVKNLCYSNFTRLDANYGLIIIENTVRMLEELCGYYEAYDIYSDEIKIMKIIIKTLVNMKATMTIWGKHKLYTPYFDFDN